MNSLISAQREKNETKSAKLGKVLTLKKKL